MTTLGTTFTPLSAHATGPASLLLRIFDSEHVRSVTIDGEPWFVAKDVCAALGISDHRQAREGLPQEGQASAKVPTATGLQTARVLDKETVVELLLRSRKPQAREFKRWLFQVALGGTPRC